MYKNSCINNQSNRQKLNFIVKKVFQFCIAVIILFGIKDALKAQPTGRNIKVNDRITQRATTSVAPQAVVIKENPKRLNISSATLKNEFNALRQDDYSIVPLKLPGSDKVSDYYVKKSGSKLILNGDIIVGDFSVQSTMSYTKDDETHTFGKDDLYRWPNGTVPVVLENSVFSGDNYNVIKSALDYFNFNTGIIFKERTGEEDYLVITCIPDDGSGKAGSAAVGRQRNGSNFLELINGKFLLQDVLIDSSHNNDTGRILFSKQAAFTIDSFFTFNHDREELAVKQVHFLGKQQKLLFNEILLNRFETDSSQPIKLLSAKGLILNGVNSNEIVKNKNLFVDTIICKEINIYELPAENLKTTPSSNQPKKTDSTGFTNVYSISLKRHVGTIELQQYFLSNY